MHDLCSLQRPIGLQPFAASHCSAAQLALQQQVLLASYQGRMDAQLLLTGDDQRFADSLALCCALPGDGFAAMRRCLSREATDAAPSTASPNLAVLLRETRYLQKIAWCGVAVPLTHAAPGADIARAQPGALSRPGRRAMVLRRVAGRQNTRRTCSAP